jgi:plastocyanin
MVTGQDYPIGINVTREGGKTNFTFSPSRLHVNRGDAVHWVSQDGPFAVEFVADTPGDRMCASGHAPGSGEWVSDTMEIRGDARGRYHYAAAVSLPARSGDEYARVVLDAGCPEIIVD